MVDVDISKSWNGAVKSGAGSVLAIASGATATIENVVFEDNTVSGNNAGNVIYNAGTIENLTGVFKNNKQNQSSGGVIYNVGGTINNITGIFIDNSKYEGGVISDSSGNTDCTCCRL